MFYKFRLQPLNGHDSILEFEWNPDSGQVRGTGALNYSVIEAMVTA